MKPLQGGEILHQCKGCKTILMSNYESHSHAAVEAMKKLASTMWLWSSKVTQQYLNHKLLWNVWHLKYSSGPGCDRLWNFRGSSTSKTAGRNRKPAKANCKVSARSVVAGKLRGNLNCMNWNVQSNFTWTLGFRTPWKQSYFCKTGHLNPTMNTCDTLRSFETELS